MPLPTPPLATGSVAIDGTDVPIRSLSRDEVVRLADLDTTAAEVLIIASGTGVPEDEATAWRKAVDAVTARTLLDAIGVLSGLRSGKR